MTLSLKQENKLKELSSISICHKGKKSLSYLLVGLDYKSNSEFNTYRQAMYQVLNRARKLGYSDVQLGYSSDFEKKKFGATQIESCAYMQVKDNYNMEALGAISVSKKYQNK